MEINGKYGTAIVYTDDIEPEAIAQIINLLNQPMAENASLRIMPDVHYGKGCVVGYTAKLTDKIIPNLIGVDIGCGVSSWKLGKRSDVGSDFSKLDKFIRENIPSGRNVNEEAIDEEILEACKLVPVNMVGFKTDIEIVCKTTHQDFDRVWRSLGTLGGGNHFVEVDLDDRDNLWLTIHSGSRNFGLKVAAYHQQQAIDSLLGMSKHDFEAKVEEIKKTKKGKGIEEAIRQLRNLGSRNGKVTGLEYLEGENAQVYFHDMQVAQLYAQVNRRLMGLRIVALDYKLRISQLDAIESVHNYINFKDKVVRKGAISAHAGEKVIIPLNMADGIIIGTGKGNDEWNNSAPHGAGRRMSRTKAKASIQLEDFQERMKNVWSSTVDKHTLDEAPQAYKKAEDIIKYLEPTVDIEYRMTPVYNYKASE